MLATYEVLMKELVHIDRFFESSRERRASLTSGAAAWAAAPQMARVVAPTHSGEP